MNPAPALILFDIDTTLLRRAGPHHRQALVDAVRQVTGRETTTDRIPYKACSIPTSSPACCATLAVRPPFAEPWPEIVRRVQLRSG